MAGTIIPTCMRILKNIWKEIGAKPEEIGESLDD